MLYIVAWLFIFTDNTWASENDLIITEIIYDPSGNNSEHSKWIEIYNSGDDYIFQTKKSGSSYKLVDFYTCDGYRIKKNDAEPNKCVEHTITTEKSEIILKSEDFLLIATDIEKFKNDYAVESEVLKSSINLSSGSLSFIKFCFKDDDHCSSLQYSDYFNKKLEGYSLEKIELNGNNSPKNWQESYEIGGTPGKKSSTKKVYSKDVGINEILPDPEGDEKEEEFIELYNFSNSDIDLTNWSLEDLGGHKFTFSKEYCKNKNSCEIKSNDFIAITSKDYSPKSLTLNNDDDSLFLFDPNGDKASGILYENPPDENISYNFNGQKWRWSRFLTPGKENKFNNLPESKEKKDKNIYVGMYADFSSSASDKDRDKLKFVWDFGDGRKSYLQKTRHKFEKAGKYTVILKISDGSENKIETFDIKVKKYPESKMKIISVVPNPSGIDSKNEYIVVRNQTKKKINLKGWSVATGSKNLYNHPITKKLMIKPGQTLKITRKISKFTLNNKKGKIELRYPNGKVADKLKYNKGGESVEDDEIYEETAEGWQWLESQINAEKMESQINAEVGASINVENSELQINEENFDELMGGQSVDESGGKNKEELLNYGTNIKLASWTASEQGKVLGAETVRVDGNNYHFVERAEPKKLLIAKFLEKIGTEANFLINKLLFSFSS